MNKDYIAEYEILKKECLEKRDVVFDKYKGMITGGLDGDYKQDRELGVITEWFIKELEKLKNKYDV